MSGLDNIKARRWLNIQLISQAVELARDDDEGMLFFPPLVLLILFVHLIEEVKWDPRTLITCINGGTEGWKGETRVITPHRTPCFECLVDLFPKGAHSFQLD